MPLDSSPGPWRLAASASWTPCSAPSASLPMHSLLPADLWCHLEQNSSQYLSFIAKLEIKAAVPRLLSWYKKESCVGLYQLRMWSKPPGEFGCFFPLQAVCCNLKAIRKKMLTSASWGQEWKTPWKFNIVAEHFLFLPLSNILRLPERNLLYFAIFPC